MLVIQGQEIDLEKSSDGTDGRQWNLVFTSGQYIGPSVSRTVEPVQFRLKKSDYNSKLPQGWYIYYNPYINKYNILQKDQIPECNDLGYNIGGFIISNCKMMFLYPECSNDVEYIRPFAEEYDTAFEKREIKCEDYDDYCGAFNELGFDTGFEIDCPIIEDNNAFKYAEFDPAEFETLPN